MKSGRRDGTEGARTRAAILDATAAIMREEGYAAVTSRRVAERASLRPSLVHYHFGSMEELLLTLYKRTEEEYLARHIDVLTSDDPFGNLWRFVTDPSGTQLVLEFIALAGHNKAVREEMARSGEIVRKVEIAFFSKLLKTVDVDHQEFPPAVVSFLIAAAARALVTEDALGISSGHAEVRAFFERRLRALPKKRVDAASDADGA
jgi:AcrR family transcriptional regulator